VDDNGADAPKESPTKRTRDEEEGDVNPQPAKKADTKVEAAAGES